MDARGLAVGDDPEPCGGASVSQELVALGDDTLGPVILDNLATDLALAEIRVAREYLRSVLDGNIGQLGHRHDTGLDRVDDS
jgi:hypothetical protein